jgi:hypothetical protein
MRVRTLMALVILILGICGLVGTSALSAGQTDLSVSDQPNATAIAASDSRVSEIVGKGEATQDETSIWEMERQSSVLGAVVHYSFSQPENIEADWELVLYNDNEDTSPPYTIETIHKYVPNITGVSVWVDFSGSKVVGIEPDSSEVAIDAPNELASASESMSVNLSAADVHTAAQPMRVKASSGPGRSASRLRVVCPGLGFCFYNYDFDSAKPEAYGSKMKRHVDMPVTIIWYQNASHDQVNEVL